MKHTTFLIIVLSCVFVGSGLIVFVVFFTITDLDNLVLHVNLVTLGFAIAIFATLLFPMFVTVEPQKDNKP